MKENVKSVIAGLSLASAVILIGCPASLVTLCKVDFDAVYSSTCPPECPEKFPQEVDVRICVNGTGDQAGKSCIVTAKQNSCGTGTVGGGACTPAANAYTFVGMESASDSECGIIGVQPTPAP